MCWIRLNKSVPSWHSLLPVEYPDSGKTWETSITWHDVWAATNNDYLLFLNALVILLKDRGHDSKLTSTVDF